MPDVETMDFESRVHEWIVTRIGEASAQSVERGARLLEESVELAQSEGVSREEAHRQIDHVYDREPGDALQEAGGVAVCLYGWCAARGVKLSDIALAEIERIEALPIEKIRDSLARKQAAALLQTSPRKHQPFEYDPLPSDLPQNEICQLQATITGLNAALMHWRREADRDAGRIARMNAALFRIAHGHDDLEAVRKITKEALL